MRSNVILGLLSASMMMAMGAGAVLAQPAIVWEAGGFQAPESVLYDAERDILYVSNINGAPDERDGNGYISKLSLDGDVMEAEWVTGLDAPKGLALAGGRLYAADIDQLVEIDIATGEIVQRYPAEGAVFLNDAATDASGRVFVSDTFGNAIYVLSDGALTLWLKDEALLAPNGLLVSGDKLLIAAWGVVSNGFETSTPGHVLAASLTDKSIGDIGDAQPIGNLDGLVANGAGGYLATDYMAGALFLVPAAGAAEKLLDLNPGSADLGVAPGLALIPMMNDGTVVAYRIE